MFSNAVLLSRFKSRKVICSTILLLVSAIALMGADDSSSLCSIDPLTNKCVDEEGNACDCKQDCGCAQTNNDLTCSSCALPPSNTESNSRSDAQSNTRSNNTPRPVVRKVSQTQVPANYKVPKEVWTEESKYSSNVYKRISELTSGNSSAAQRGVTLSQASSRRATLKREEIAAELYAFWNGSINLVNILEIGNADEKKIEVDVIFYKANGSVAKEIPVSLEASGQKDLVLNDIPGFSKDSYGLIKILSSSLKVSGRVTYYRPSEIQSGTNDFVFSAPFSSPVTGESAVSFNTYNPTLKASEISNLVANWLTIVNLDENRSRAFKVSKFSQTGAPLSVDTLTLSALERYDYEAGHVKPGPDHVGLIVVTPLGEGAEDAPYTAQLMRYGYNAPPTDVASGFDFAFLLSAQQTNKLPIFSTVSLGEPVQTASEHQNWLEISNTSNSKATVTTKFYKGSGELAHTEISTLGAYAQVHLNASNFLGEGEFGSAMIQASEPGKVIAQSMYYFRNSETGSMLSMYGIQAQEWVSNVPPLISSWNRFLRTQNHLIAYNPNAHSITTQVYIGSVSGANSQVEVEMPAHTTYVFDLQNTDQFATSADSYGIVIVTGGAVGEVLRTVYEPSQFAQRSIIDNILPKLAFAQKIEAGKPVVTNPAPLGKAAPRFESNCYQHVQGCTLCSKTPPPATMNCFGKSFIQKDPKAPDYVTDEEILRGLGALDLKEEEKNILLSIIRKTFENPEVWQLLTGSINPWTKGGTCTLNAPTKDGVPLDGSKRPQCDVYRCPTIAEVKTAISESTTKPKKNSNTAKGSDFAKCKPGFGSTDADLNAANGGGECFYKNDSWNLSVVKDGRNLSVVDDKGNIDLEKLKKLITQEGLLKEAALFIALAYGESWDKVPGILRLLASLNVVQRQELRDAVERVLEQIKRSGGIFTFPEGMTKFPGQVEIQKYLQLLYKQLNDLVNSFELTDEIKAKIEETKSKILVIEKLSIELNIQFRILWDIIAFQYQDGTVSGRCSKCVQTKNKTIACYTLEKVAQTEGLLIANSCLPPEYNPKVDYCSYKFCDPSIPGRCANGINPPNDLINPEKVKPCPVVNGSVDGSRCKKDIDNPIPPTTSSTTTTTKKTSSTTSTTTSTTKNTSSTVPDTTSTTNTQPTIEPSSTTTVTSATSTSTFIESTTTSTSESSTTTFDGEEEEFPDDRRCEGEPESRTGSGGSSSSSSSFPPYDPPPPPSICESLSCVDNKDFPNAEIIERDCIPSKRAECEPDYAKEYVVEVGKCKATKEGCEFETVLTSVRISPFDSPSCKANYPGCTGGTATTSSNPSCAVTSCWQWGAYNPHNGEWDKEWTCKSSPVVEKSFPISCIASHARRGEHGVRVNKLCRATDPEDAKTCEGSCEFAILNKDNDCKPRLVTEQDVLDGIVPFSTLGECAKFPPEFPTSTTTVIETTTTQEETSTTEEPTTTAQEETTTTEEPTTTTQEETSTTDVSTSTGNTNTSITQAPTTSTWWIPPTTDGEASTSTTTTTTTVTSEESTTTFTSDSTFPPTTDWNDSSDSSWSSSSSG